MAPALTEPLSSKEKLSSSAATASPTTAPTNRGNSRKHDTSPTASASAAASTTAAATATVVTRKSVSTPNNNIAKDKSTVKSASTSAIIATSSSRVTRSKDTQNQQKSLAGSGSIAKLMPIAARRINNNNNNNKQQRENYEQMGLSAARNKSHNSTSSTNNNSGDSSSNQDIDAKKSSSEELRDTTHIVDTTVATVPNCKDNSTEQLLADLTNDFEETITAEICLRNKLPELTLSKEAASETVGVGVGLQSLSGGVDAPDTAVPDAEVLQLMASQLCEPTTPTATTVTTLTVTTTTAKEAEATQAEITKSEKNEPVSKEEVNVHTDSKQELQVLELTRCLAESIAHGKKTPAITTKAQFKSATLLDQPTCSTRMHMSGVKELPQVSTDSTMTSSEIEDNLEERLSQLDGNGAAPLPTPTPALVMPQEEQEATALTAISTVTTPTRHAILQHQPQEQQLVDVLVSQTPPTPVTTALQQQQQQQLATLTPQSTNSAISSVSLPQGFLKESAGGDELGDQDIEEVLKALKGFEGVANSDIDLNVFFSDVFQNVGNNYNNFEDVNSQNAGTSSASNSTNIIGSGAASSSSSNHPLLSSETKVSPLNEAYTDIKTKQELLTNRVESLLRRLRKLQARHMCKHTSVEIAGLFEWSARMSTKMHYSVWNAALSDQELAAMAVVSGRPPSDFWQVQKHDPVPSVQMSTMLRRLETVASEQQLCTTPPTSSMYGSSTYMQQQPTRRPRKQQQQQQDAAAATSSSTTTTTATSATTDARTSLLSSEPKPDEVVPNYDSYAASELTHVAGLLHTEMREVQNAIDSDATESSSGGESADEMVTYNNKTQHPLSIAKRAVWRYSRDRAAIALRWSWLLTQVKDLNVKIRQHNELHTEITRSRGKIVLEPVKQSSAKSSQQESVNGYKSNNSNNNSNVSDSESEVEQGCSRTRALVLTSFRKRKLFQTTNMHTISKKAARPSNIKCGCQWPRQPCTLCTGRADPTAPRALPDTMMPANRVALLDPGYHPVLSFPEDVCQSIYFETIARQPAWQYRVMRCQAKAIVKSVWKAEREAAAALAGSGRRHGAGGAAGDQPITKRRYIRRKDRNADTGGGDNNNKTTTAKGAAATVGTAAITASTASSGGVFTNESGNGTASTSSSSTPTTPLVANTLVNKRQRRTRKNLAQTQNEQQLNLPKTEQYSNSNPNSLVHITSISTSIKNRKTATILAAAAATSTATTTSNSNLNHTYNQYNQQFATSSSQSNVNFGDNYSHHSHHHQQQQHNNNSDHQCNDLSTQRSRTSSPTHGGSKSGQQRHHERANRSRVSYDIDNIVIPYSIAAATRVEILPYKEIPTPKWRILDCEDDSDDQLTEHQYFQMGSDAPNVFEKLTDDEADVQAAIAAIENATALIKSTKCTNPPKVNGALAKKDETLVSQQDVPHVKVVETKQINRQMEKANKNNAGIKAVEAVVLPPLTKNNHKNVAALVNGQFAAKDNDHLALLSNKRELTTLETETNTPAIKNNNNNLLKLNNLYGDESNQIGQKDTINSTPQLLLPPEPLAKKRKLQNGTLASRGDHENNVAATIAAAAAGVAAADKAKPGEILDATSKSSKDLSITITGIKEMLGKLEAEPLAEVPAAKDDDEEEEEDDEEDVSEDAFNLRHERALVEERRKFITYLKFPLCTRSRANRRVDSRAESSGANTPDPASPAPQTASTGGGDNESVPSPLAQPLPNPLDTLHEANESNLMAQPSSSSKWYNYNSQSKRQERRRTTSLKNKESSERRSISPEFVQPYETRKFPLPDEEVDKMMAELNESYKRKYVVYKFNEDDINAGNYSGAAGTSRRYHASKSTSSSVYSNDGAGNGKRRNYSKQNVATQRKAGTQRPNGGKIHDTADDDDDDAAAAASGGGGGSIGYDDDDCDDIIRPEDILNAVDDEDDDYPKHHLAPNDDVNSYYYEGTDAHCTLLGDDSETDDANDPFMDDDPNDPEWRRGLGVRTEQRVRRKL